MSKDEQNNVTAEVERVSTALEGLIANLRPMPSLETLSVTFLHWAARCALADHTEVADFKEGASVAWDCAVRDFSAAAPALLARKGQQS